MSDNNSSSSSSNSDARNLTHALGNYVHQLTSSLIHNKLGAPSIEPPKISADKILRDFCLKYIEGYDVFDILLRSQHKHNNNNNNNNNNTALDDISKLLLPYFEEGFRSGVTKFVAKKLSEKSTILPSSSTTSSSSTLKFPVSDGNDNNDTDLNNNNSNNNNNDDESDNDNDNNKNTSPTKDQKKPKPYTPTPTSALNIVRKQLMIGHSLKVANDILRKLMKNEKAKLFLRPIDIKELEIPDYYDYVKTPMDLSTVRGNLQKRSYGDVESFISDVKLVFDNAISYNGKGHVVSLLAKEMWDSFEKEVPLFKRNNAETLKVSGVRKENTLYKASNGEEKLLPLTCWVCKLYTEAKTGGKLKDNFKEMFPNENENKILSTSVDDVNVVLEYELEEGEKETKKRKATSEINPDKKEKEKKDKKDKDKEKGKLLPS